MALRFQCEIPQKCEDFQISPMVGVVWERGKDVFPRTVDCIMICHHALHRLKTVKGTIVIYSRYNTLIMMRLCLGENSDLRTTTAM